MDAVILAGGEGSRLYPLTLNRPKVMMPLLGRTMLGHLVRQVRAAGLESLTVVVGPQAKQQVQEELERTAGALDTRVVVQPEPGGIADALLWARPNVESERFVLLLADNVFTAPLEDLWKDFGPAHAAGRLWVTQVDNPSSYGIAETDENNDLTGLTEKPKSPTSKLAVCGVYLLPRSVFETAEEMRPETEEFEITPVLDELHRREGLDYRLLPGEWQDAGTLNGFLRAQWILLKRRGGERRQFVHSSAQVEETELNGPVWIGPHCRVSDSRIGPNVVMAGSSTVSGVRLRNSTLLDGVRLTAGFGQAAVERSLLGRGARLELAPARHTGLMLADYSEFTARREEAD